MTKEEKISKLLFKGTPRLTLNNGTKDRFGVISVDDEYLICRTPKWFEDVLKPLNDINTNEANLNQAKETERKISEYQKPKKEYEKFLFENGYLAKISLDDILNIELPPFLN